jgi:hypothetical protein
MDIFCPCGCREELNQKYAQQQLMKSPGIADAEKATLDPEGERAKKSPRPSTASFQ